jgi:hypothetical protein
MINIESTKTGYREFAVTILTDSWPNLELSELDLESEAKESELACFEWFVSEFNNSAPPLLSIL